MASVSEQYKILLCEMYIFLACKPCTHVNVHMNLDEMLTFNFYLLSLSLLSPKFVKKYENPFKRLELKHGCSLHAVQNSCWSIF